MSALCKEARLILANKASAHAVEATTAYTVQCARRCLKTQLHAISSSVLYLALLCGLSAVSTRSQASDAYQTQELCTLAESLHLAVCLCPCILISAALLQLAPPLQIQSTVTHELKVSSACSTYV
jgi:hypothetical protein